MAPSTSGSDRQKPRSPASDGRTRAARPQSTTTPRQRARDRAKTAEAEYAPASPRRRTPPVEGTSVGRGRAQKMTPVHAADHAVRRNSKQVRLPFLGDVTLPASGGLVWYAGVGVLVAAGMVDWPIAAILAVGHLLSENRSNRVLHDLGEALEEA